MLLVAISFRGLVQLTLDPKGASLPLWDANATRHAWAVFFLGTLAAVNVLGVALLWVVASSLAIFIISGHPSANRAQLLCNSALLHSAMATITVPVYIAMYFHVRAYGPLLQGLDWIPPVTVNRLLQEIRSVYLLQICGPISSRLFPGGVLFMDVLIASFAILGLFQLRRLPLMLSVLTLAVVVLPLGLLAISIFLPMWLPRYLLWSTVPFFIVSGLGIAQLPQRFQLAATMVVGFLVFVNLMPYYTIETKPRWDVAARSLEPAIANGDLVLVADYWVPRMVNFYLSRERLVLSRDHWTSEITTATRWLADGGRVWAVFGRVAQADHEPMGSFLQRISALGSPVVQIGAGLDVIILVFEGAGSTHGTTSSVK